MSRPTKSSKLAALTKKHFRQKGRRVYPRAELEKLFIDYVDQGIPPVKMGINQFIVHSEKTAELKRVIFRFPSRNVHRFCWGEFTVFELGLTIDPKAYYSHQSALFFHGLSSEIGSPVYLNVEQPAKEKTMASDDLRQDRVSYAFKGKPRVSKTTALIEKTSFVLLNGKNTGNLGVVETRVQGFGALKVTDLERTLVDVAVRPFYAGGIKKVLNAYKLAKGKVSVPRILSLLQEMDFIYPYQQSIGFLLEKSGACTPQELKVFEAEVTEIDFYIEYGLKSPAYSKRWKIYYPPSLDI